MSPESTIDAEVRMLPPSYAIYLPGALIIPVLVRPAQGTDPVRVHVAPVVLAANTSRVHWSLVLLSQDPAERAQFAAEAIEFKLSGGIIPTGDQIHLSGTQVALVNFLISTEITAYDINFHLGKGPFHGPVIKASIKADPAVSVVSDPVDIPSWP